MRVSLVLKPSIIDLSPMIIVSLLARVGCVLQCHHGLPRTIEAIA
jgi:hypothetical protein